MGLPRFIFGVYQDCICIKVPEGNIENYSKQKIVLNELYKVYITGENGEVYNICSYESGLTFLTRDKKWFDEYFATKETLRDIKINELFK